MNNRLVEFPQSKIPLPGFGILVTARRRKCESRLASIRCALRGLRDAWNDQPNLRVHVAAGCAAVILGAWCHLAALEWLWISFAIGLVIFAEIMNTAIEETVDLVVGLRPDPLARRVKDVAAACVLVAAMLAVAIGVFTFVPHLLATIVRDAHTS